MGTAMKDRDAIQVTQEDAVMQIPDEDGVFMPEKVIHDRGAQWYVSCAHIEVVGLGGGRISYGSLEAMICLNQVRLEMHSSTYTQTDGLIVCRVSSHPGPFKSISLQDQRFGLTHVPQEADSGNTMCLHCTN
jgi:hypothetical protein